MITLENEHFIQLIIATKAYQLHWRINIKTEWIHFTQETQTKTTIWHYLYVYIHIMTPNISSQYCWNI